MGETESPHVLLADLADPAVLVLDLTALNAGQGLAQTLHDGAGGLVTVREDDDRIIIVDLAHRRDDGRSTCLLYTSSYRD